jgi:Enolase C-terminal domain-like
MTATALAIRTDARKNGRELVGLAFDSIGRYDHTGLLRDRFIPRLMSADPKQYADGQGGIDPTRAWSVVMRNEKSGGHGERCGAVGLIDAALWDLAAKTNGVPLWDCLMDSERASHRGVAEVYASGGHYRAHGDVEGVCDDVKRAIARGHRRFKIKIGGADFYADIRRIEAVLSILESGMSLAVDANNAFNLQQFATVRRLCLMRSALVSNQHRYFLRSSERCSIDRASDEWSIPMTATTEQPLSREEIRSLVRDDTVHRRAYADADVFMLEQQRIFGRLWIYVAHESQLRNTGDFIRTRLAEH